MVQEPQIQKQNDTIRHITMSVILLHELINPSSNLSWSSAFESVASKVDHTLYFALSFTFKRHLQNFRERRMWLFVHWCPLPRCWHFHQPTASDRCDSTWWVIFAPRVLSGRRILNHSNLRYAFTRTPSIFRR